MGEEPMSSEMPRPIGVAVLEGEAGSSGLSFSVGSSSVGLSRSVMSSLGRIIVYGVSEKRVRRRRRTSRKSSMAKTAATATSAPRAIPIVLAVGRVVCARTAVAGVGLGVVAGDAAMET